MNTATVEPKKRRTPEQKESDMIDEIMENFDFEKCHRLMMGLNWVWGFTNKVPSVEELKKSAIHRMKDAIELAKENKCHKSTYFCSSGGLKGSATINRYGRLDYLLLEFVATDWDSTGE